ncbi:MAG TPA: VIT domain-containing protein [Planctomycetota bacterium]
MIRRLAAVLCLAALAGCNVGTTSSAPASGLPPRYAEVNTRTNQFGGLEFDLEETTRRDAFRKGEKTDEELLIIERSRLGYPKQIRGAEMWAKTPTRTIPLPLKHTDVKAQISIYIGSVTVTQQYHNPYDSKIEAVYVFPLPDDAAIRDFVMTIGERRIRGIIREREEAEKIYLEARARGHVASLLTQERANIFTQKVANIEPGKRIDISITYFHTMRYQDGTFEFAFPMVVGPRYNPAGTTDGVGAVPAGKSGSSGQKTEVQYLPPDTVSSHDIALEVDLDAGLPIEKLESPTHVIDVQRPSESRAKVALGRHDRIPNKDFVLRWRPGGAGVRAAVATQDGYFTLLLQPPAALADVAPLPREMIFVLDCSGSMNGYPLAAAKRAMEKCLRRLGADDTFQIIRFSSDASAMGPAPVPATVENVRQGLAYLESLNSEGGTEMITGIRAALGYPHTPGRYRIVSFMTDGYIGNERDILQEIQRRLGPARIFSFGVGTSVNRYLIEGMARVGRGTSTYVLADDASQKAVDELYTRIERPALTDLSIEGGVEIHPSPLPDLFVGRPVVITGRYQGDGPLRVKGLVGGKPWAAEVALKGTSHPALPAVWARAKIASLHDRMSTSSDTMECLGAIQATALAHGLLSDFTAFVAVDSLRRTEGQSGTTVVQPVPTPKGVNYETTVEKKK